MSPLTILYQDEYYVTIDKPDGLLVHRSDISRDEVFVLQTLRDQLGQRVYPIHRLDRPTSGVLVMGLSSDAARRLVEQFEQRQTRKTYLALVRGYTPETGGVDYPVGEKGKPLQEALTRYRRLATVELPFPVTRYPSSRYSLVEVTPETGRWHQIRRHFAHIRHPVIGDTTHGEGRHNRFYRERYGLERLMLMARSLGFTHPYSGEAMTISAPLPGDWQRLFEQFGWLDLDV